MRTTGNPHEDFDRAISDLRALSQSVADGRDLEAVFEAMLMLQLSVVRAYGGRRPRARPGEGAKRRILDYMHAKPGEWILGEELAVVSGIGEWARRIRELRVEDGYRIEEDAGRYRLCGGGPDSAASARWRLLNATRRRPGSAMSRIEALFEAAVGEIVTRDDLDYVAQIKEGSRRVRELRDERGWPIESHLDARDLKPGEYRLVSVDPKDKRDPRQRLYRENLREKVFERDGYTCRQCRRDKVAAEKAGDRRFFLEVHHLKAVADDLDALPLTELNDLANLATYCHVCHTEETAAFQRRRRAERKSGRRSS